MSSVGDLIINAYANNEAWYGIVDEVHGRSCTAMISHTRNRDQGPMHNFCEDPNWRVAIERPKP